MSCKQPENVGEGDSSPECLLTSEPVKDPYSTDEEKESCREEETRRTSKSTSDTIITYNGSTVTIKTLQRYFDLSFYSIFEGPSYEELLKLDIAEIVEHLLCFVTNKNEYNNGRVIINNVLKSTKSPINLLHENEEFHVNFKEANKSLPSVQRSDSAQWQIACKFLRQMFAAVEITRELHPIDSGYHHDKVKSCMSAFCKLSLDEVLQNGSCISHLQSTKANAQMRSSENPVYKTFKACPDLVLTPSNDGENFPAVPFEIYSPIKKKEEKKIKKVKKSKVQNVDNSPSGSSCSENLTTDEESKKNFLSDNIPKYMCEKSQFCESSLKSKMVAQHILEMIGAASDYCSRKYIVGGEMKKDKVFIGIFICHEYAYVAKIQGDEACLAQYTCFRQLQAGIPVEMLNLDQRLKKFASVPDPRIHVQFSSVVLDLSTHKHRMALLFFLQHYIRNWDKIETYPMRKDV